MHNDRWYEDAFWEPFFQCGIPDAQWDEIPSDTETLRQLYLRIRKRVEGRDATLEQALMDEDERAIVPLVIFIHLGFFEPVPKSGRLRCKTASHRSLEEHPLYRKLHANKEFAASLNNEGGTSHGSQEQDS